MHRAQGLRGNSKPLIPCATVPAAWPQALPCSPLAASQGKGISSEQGFFKSWSSASCCLSLQVISSVSQCHHPAAPAAPAPTGEIFWAIKACKAGWESSFGEQRPACLSESDNRAVKFHLLYSAGSLQHTGVPTDCQVVCSHTILAVLTAGSHLSL